LRWWAMSVHSPERVERRILWFMVSKVEVDRLWFFNADTDYWRTIKADADFNLPFLNVFICNNDNYNNTEWTLILT
jgi:hypothetical protein